MVDQAKSAIASINWTAVGVWMTALALVANGVLYETGQIASGGITQHDVSEMRKQLTDVQQQASEAQKQAAFNFDRLSNKLDTKLGPDALVDTVRRLSEISGRLDAMDQRQREDEKLTVQMQTQLESIDRASQAQLPGRR